MKRKIGVILLVLMMCLASAYAGSQYQTIGVYFGAVSKVFVDMEDKTVDFKEPFIYNGTTYVSLRDVSEALGKPVHWNGEEKAIYIGERPITVNYETTDLTSIPMNYYYNLYLYRINNRVEPVYNMDQNAQFDYPAGYEMRISENATDLIGYPYSNGVSLKVSDGASSLYYKLDKNYTVFKGRVGFDTVLNEYSYEEMEFRVKDGLKVLGEYTLSSDKPYADFNVNVLGVKNLTLEFELDDKDNDDEEPFVNIVNAILEEHIYN